MNDLDRKVLELVGLVAVFVIATALWVILSIRVTILVTKLFYQWS